MQLPSKLQIDDYITFLPMKRHCKEMSISKEEMSGTIVSVRFTKAKVWYDILDDYHGKIFDKVDSVNVWMPEKLNLEFFEIPIN